MSSLTKLWLLVIAAVALFLVALLREAPAQGRYNPYGDPDYRFGTQGPRHFNEQYSGRQWWPQPRVYNPHPGYIGRGALWGYSTWQRRGWR